MVQITEQDNESESGMETLTDVSKKEEGNNLQFLESEEDLYLQDNDVTNNQIKVYLEEKNERISDFITSIRAPTKKLVVSNLFRRYKIY
mmetsp:Transcript_46247/g.33995  ORF Transcript_46247/g.33995 Transcript_46247/m.33995 type:complete len:89 (+) Transcript_46247:772-1038(+)